MRDLVLILFFFSTIPYIFMYPYVGILVWSWIGYMNPHRLAYGFAYSFQFALVSAIVTFLSVGLSSRIKKKFPITPVTIFLIIFVCWMLITTLFALEPVLAKEELSRALKIQAVIFLTLILLDSKKKIDHLIWVIVFSIGFYGVKGGTFAILTGGSHRVWGPDDSFISGNNEIALALVMIVPLMVYIITELTRYISKIEKKFIFKLIRLGVIGTLILCIIAILATYSRGGFLSLAICIFLLVMRSKKKILLLIVMATAIGIGYNFLPEKWFDRMDTMTEEKEDLSMQGRYNAWWFATHVALARPITGGGFRVFTDRQYAKYYPIDYTRDAHSIYFEVLGEQGFVGLFFYLMLNFLGFMTGFKIKKLIGKREDMAWARVLSSMIQISLISFAFGGLFKGMAYWDLPYHIIAILVLMRVQIETKLKDELEQRKTTGTTLTSG